MQSCTDFYTTVESLMLNVYYAITNESLLILICSIYLLYHIAFRNTKSSAKYEYEKRYLIKL